jgi:hypothetical protein
MYVIGQSDDLALASWRVIFIVAGCGTIGAGVLFVAFMPRDPSVARFLNEEERRIAVQRLANDRATRDRSQFSTDQVKEALLDPQTWFYFAFGFLICMSSPILKVCVGVRSWETFTDASSFLRSSSTALVSPGSGPCWLGFQVVHCRSSRPGPRRF